MKRILVAFCLLGIIHFESVSAKVCEEATSIKFKEIAHFKTLAHTHFVPLNANYALQLESELRAFWKQHIEIYDQGSIQTPKMPEIDFDKQVVIATVRSAHNSGVKASIARACAKVLPDDPWNLPYIHVDIESYDQPRDQDCMLMAAGHVDIHIVVLDRPSYSYFNFAEERLFAKRCF